MNNLPPLSPLHDWLEEALFNVLTEHTQLSTDAMDNIVPKLAAVFNRSSDVVALAALCREQIEANKNHQTMIAWGEPETPKRILAALIQEPKCSPLPGKAPPPPYKVRGQYNTVNGTMVYDLMELIAKIGVLPAKRKIPEGLSDKLKDACVKYPYTKAPDLWILFEAYFRLDENGVAILENFEVIHDDRPPAR